MNISNEEKLSLIINNYSNLIATSIKASEKAKLTSNWSRVMITPDGDVFAVVGGSHAEEYIRKMDVIEVISVGNNDTSSTINYKLSAMADHLANMAHKEQNDEK